MDQLQVSRVRWIFYTTHSFVLEDASDHWLVELGFKNLLAINPHLASTVRQHFTATLLGRQVGHESCAVVNVAVLNDHGVIAQLLRELTEEAFGYHLDHLQRLNLSNGLVLIQTVHQQSVQVSKCQRSYRLGEQTLVVVNPLDVACLSGSNVNSISITYAQKGSRYAHSLQHGDHTSVLGFFRECQSIELRVTS